MSSVREKAKKGKQEVGRASPGTPPDPLEVLSGFCGRALGATTQKHLDEAIADLGCVVFQDTDKICPPERQGELIADLFGLYAKYSTPATA